MGSSPNTRVESLTVGLIHVPPDRLSCPHKLQTFLEVSSQLTVVKHGACDSAGITALRRVPAQVLVPWQYREGVQVGRHGIWKVTGCARRVVRHTQLLNAARRDYD